MGLAIKAIIGALVVIVMSILSTTKYYFIAGLVPLFPTFALIAHIIVGRNGAVQLQHTVLFGMLSLIPYFFYLMSVYLLSDRIVLHWNLLLSTAVWCIWAVLMYLVWMHLGGVAGQQ